MWKVGFTGLFVGLVLGGAATAVASSGAQGLYSNQELGRVEQPGEESLAARLLRRERSLDLREQTIEEQEQSLRDAEESLRGELADLQAIRDEIRALKVELDDEHEVQVEKLVKMFESMRAKQAAAVLEEAEVPVALGVLRVMKSQRAGPILAAMTPTHAALLTEKIANQPMADE